MSINLDNVTAIVHNNKDVIKIEDSNGNVIWQQQSGDKYLFRLNSNTSTALNTRTLEFTKFDAGSSNSNAVEGNCWTDGTNVYLSRGNGTITDSRYQRVVNFNGNTVSTSPANTWNGGPSTLLGCYTFTTNGTDIYASTSSINNVYKLTPSTKEWVSSSLSGTSSGYKSTDIFKFGGVTYCIYDSNHIKMYNTTTNQWGFKKNQSGSAYTMQGKYFWSPDGVHLFYTDGTYNLKYNASTFDTVNSYWSGPTASSSSVQNMFKIDNDTYLITGTTNNWVIYKLDNTTLDNTTLTWTDVTSQFTIPADTYIMGIYIDEDGVSGPQCGYGLKARDLT